MVFVEKIPFLDKKKFLRDFLTSHQDEVCYQSYRSSWTVPRYRAHWMVRWFRLEWIRTDLRQNLVVWFLIFSLWAIGLVGGEFMLLLWARWLHFHSMFETIWQQRLSCFLQLFSFDYDLFDVFVGFFVFASLLLSIYSVKMLIFNYYVFKLSNAVHTDV